MKRGEGWIMTCACSAVTGHFIRYTLLKPGSPKPPESQMAAQLFLWCCLPSAFCGVLFFFPFYFCIKWQTEDDDSCPFPAHDCIFVQSEQTELYEQFSVYNAATSCCWIIFCYFSGHYHVFSTTKDHKSYYRNNCTSGYCRHVSCLKGVIVCMQFFKVSPEVPSQIHNNSPALIIIRMNWGLYGKCTIKNKSKVTGMTRLLTHPC